MVAGVTDAAPVGIIGAGIVGLAVARQLAAAGVPVVVLEKEPTVAAHQTGHNSGVVHAGIYYAPGSAKAKMTRHGVGLLRAYCADRGLAWDERGKLVVARNEAETVKLRELERRSSSSRPGSSDSLVATITFPQRSAGIPFASQYSYSSRATASPTIPAPTIAMSQRSLIAARATRARSSRASPARIAPS